MNSSEFTLLFEAITLSLIENEIPINKAAKLLSVHPNRIWRIFHYWINIAYQKDDPSGVTKLGFDETSRKKGHRYVKYLRQSRRYLTKRLQTQNWSVELIYLALPNPEISKMRVEERVAHGGHNIPTKDIVRRFPRSLNNLLSDFSFAANSCTCFMNANEQPILVFEQKGQHRHIVHDKYFNLLKKQAIL